MRIRKDISLDGYKLYVSDEGYEQILALARVAAVCPDCGHLYTEENPNVAGLLCLACFQRQHQGKTFMGPLDPAVRTAAYGEDRYPDHGPWPRIEYCFLDARGSVFTTTGFPSNQDRPQEWEKLTVCYWKFPLPQEAQWNGGTIETRRFNLSIFGNPRESETIMLRFYDYVGNKTQELLFLALRNGQAIQINKRKGRDRELFAAARAELEATKSGDGNYFVDGQWKSWLHESDTYRLLVQKIEQRRLQEEAEQRPLIETTEGEEEERA